MGKLWANRIAYVLVPLLESYYNLPHMRSHGGACEVILGTHGLTHTNCARELVSLTVNGLNLTY